MTSLVQNSGLTLSNLRSNLNIPLSVKSFGEKGKGQKFGQVLLKIPKISIFLLRKKILFCES